MRISLFVAGLIMAAPAAAVPPPAPEVSIVVHGTHDRDKKISRFIDDLTPAPVRGQLSRFDAPVCPAVAGLPPEKEAYIVARLRQIAGAAGMAVGTPGCDANVILVVARDKNDLLKQLEQHRPEYFPSTWSSWRIHALEHEPYPVAAWQFEGEFWADGRPIAGEANASGISDILQLQRTTEPLTRLRPSARRDFLTSIIVVQQSALTGLTTTQLADYTAMRAFVRTDPKQLRGSASDTILGVIDAPMGSAVPLTLTAWDLSFLKAFYASGKNSYANYQRSEMHRLMARELDQAESAGR
jgi:hypothetical protein